MGPGQKLRLLFAACSMAAIALVAREGWVTRSYPDPVHGNRVPTACAGVTEGIKPGQVFTEQECIERTALAMVKHAGPILRCVPDTMDMRYAGYLSEQVDIAYNIGVGNYLGIGKSRPSGMCRHMKAGDYRASCEAILAFKYAGGKDCSLKESKCPGVWNRRLEQRANCLKALPK